MAKVIEKIKIEKLKERTVKDGKYYCTDDTKGKIVRIICERELPDSEIDKHLKRHK
ncbi:MAG: hypothetical protein ABIJ40_09540 [Bacteroidota bacterium]